MDKDQIISNSATPLPDTTRRGFLGWLGGITAIGLSGGLAGLPLAQAASANAGSVAGAGASPGLAGVSAAVAGSVVVPAMPVHKGGQTLLDSLTLDSFTPHVNTQFVFAPTTLDSVSTEVASVETAESAEAPARPVTMELVEARVPKARQDVKVTEAFMLVFRGPANVPLAQETYEVRHPGVGTFPLFIVPIAEDDAGLYYQAIFNRLIQA